MARAYSADLRERVVASVEAGRRLGLVVATAVGIQPRFAGTLTLELRNLGEAPLSLYPGQLIAQLFFHTVKDAEAGQGIGQYNGAVDLLPKQMSPAATHDKLEKLRSNRRA